MTPAELLQAIQAAKILASGANLTIPKAPDDKTDVRAVLHGWVLVEAGGKQIKIRENRNNTTIRRAVLRCIDPGANLNAIRSKALTVAFSDFVSRVKEVADSAAQARLNAEAPKIEQLIQKTISARKIRMKREDYKRGCEILENLFQKALFDMEEEELLEIFRLNRVKHIMES